MAYRIVIDRRRCESNGYCFEKAAALIVPSREGSPQIISKAVPADQDSAARAAVAACPMGALSLEPALDSIC